MYQNKVFVPDNEGLKRDLIAAFHDAPSAGHPGQQRTLELVSRHYHWPGIRSRVYEHVDSCEECQRNRLPKKVSIPLKPLEVPTRPWQHVSYDMITGYPEDKGNNAILVIVDSFSKYGVFVACSKSANAKKVAELFLDNWWKRFGLPEKVISDRGTVFNNKFTRDLYKRLGIKPHFSSAYHPESDGQTERVNQPIEHFLRIYAGIEQDSWSRWLPMAEFSYNNAVHSATRMSPFQCLYGQNPVMSPTKIQVENPEAETMATLIEKQREEAQSALRLAKESMTRGQGEEVPKQFNVGEKVWVLAKNIQIKSSSPKLNNKRIGPFPIRKKLSDWAYEVELPETLKIHPVFYIGLLSKAVEDEHRPFLERPPPEVVEGEEEYEVEAIVDHKREKGTWWYLVKWKGYGPESNTWEPRHNITHAEKILKAYSSKILKKAHDSAKALKGGAVS